MVGELRQSMFATLRTFSMKPGTIPVLFGHRMSVAAVSKCSCAVISNFLVSSRLLVKCLEAIARGFEGVGIWAHLRARRLRASWGPSKAASDSRLSIVGAIKRQPGSSPILFQHSQVPCYLSI
jgi:hypothetical protein